MSEANCPRPEPALPPERLIEQLHRIDVQPSQRFYRRMAAMPWSLAAQKVHQPSRSGPLHRMLVVTGALVLCMLLTSMSPAILSYTGNLFGLLRAPSDTIPVPPNEISHPWTPPPRREIAEVEQRVGFDLLEPTYLPPGFTFETADAFRGVGTAQASYADLGHPDRQPISVVQQRLADVAKTQSELDQVAPDAKLEHVEVNGHPAVLVYGFWVGATDAEGHMVYTWDHTIIQRLIWEADGFRFRLIADPSLPREEMLAVARSLR